MTPIAKLERTTNPRHAKLSKELASLLVWRRFSDSLDPLATNWCVPANDNESETDAAPSDCKYEIRPTVKELMRSAGIRVIERGSPRKASWPLSGTTAPVARICGLAFATERNVPGYPMGSLLTWRTTPEKSRHKPSEKFGKPKGGYESKQAAEDVRASNDFFAALLGTDPHRYIPGKPRQVVKRPPIELPLELRGTTPLADARAWAGLPAVKLNSCPALPCGSRSAADSFIGHRVTRQVKDTIWVANSPHEHFERKQDNAALESALAPADVLALDSALACRSFEELGRAFGYTGKTAERQGNRRLLMAAKNLSTALEKIAA
jgi:hypothetical protein